MKDSIVDPLLIRKIEKEEVGLLQTLFENSSDYFLLNELRPPRTTEAIDFFVEVPAGKNLRDKVTLGIFSNHVLVGILDIIKNFPYENTLFINLLLINLEHRKKGIGREVFNNIFENKDSSFYGKDIYLHVSEQNKGAISFWEKCGFIEDSIIEKCVHSEIIKIIIMKKESVLY